MKFIIETWDIKKLLELVDSGKIDLNPAYQRNPIWTIATQKSLIESIKNGSPIPNIFLFQKEEGIYEMVDGQQRTRAIRAFKHGNSIDLGQEFEEFKKSKFLEYQIPVSIITETEPTEYIEDFYYLVNSSGIKLNRPETFKAQYLKTNFLLLVEKLTNSDLFQELKIIPPNSQKRMMDRELVEELCALIMFGITDKKTQVDKIYENDISIEESNGLELKFKEIITQIIHFNTISPIKDTRYRQRNDFYTLFGFIKDNLGLENTTLESFYKIMLILEKGIRPTKAHCPPLAEYALNCVSQSNSSKARITRVEIFNNIFLNDKDKPNDIQNEIIQFYNLNLKDLIRIGKYLTFNHEKLQEAILKHV